MVVRVARKQKTKIRRPASAAFPLHMTVFERYMLRDDRPDHPMTFTMQVELEGAADGEALEAALAIVLERHPLLCANLRPLKRGELCWVAADVPPRLIWSDGARPEIWDRNCPEYINLTVEAGLRVFVHVGLDRTVLTLQFHHSATDGCGAYRFIGDLLAAYGVETTTAGAPRPTLPPLDANGLRERGKAMLDLALGDQQARLSLRAAGEALNLANPLVRRLPAPAAGAGLGRRSPYPHIESFTFKRGAYARLRETAATVGATTNDLLLAELFVALARWSETHDGRGWGARLRIGMPTDMRRAADRDLPAACLASHTFLTRRASDCTDALELLASIRDETTSIKQQRRGARFGDMLTVAERTPGAITAALRLGLVRCTAVLSNVGDPIRRFGNWFPQRDGRIVCGNLTLARITGAPPVRADMPVSLFVLTYNGELTISANCDPHRFAPEDAREFLAGFISGLRGRAGEGGDRQSSAEPPHMTAARAVA